MSAIADLIRQCVSPYVQGSEIDAILGAITDEMLQEQKVSLASYGQLFLSTASGKYLDKKTAEFNLIRPPEIGLDDYVFRKLGIQISNTSQILSLVGNVLETFYGTDTTRTWAESLNAEPYALTVGQQLIFSIDGKNLIYEVQAADFDAGTLGNVTAAALASAITRTIVQSGSSGFASSVFDQQTNANYLQITTGVIGPTGSLSITGGELQIVLDFPTITAYPATIPVTWTSWAITRSGNTVRFSWLGNADPHLEVVNQGDIALIYGANFIGVGALGTDLRGTFTITNVQTGGVFDPSNPDTAAFFEVENDNALIQNGEIISINQGVQNALRFYQPKLYRPYLRPRYALAWESNNKTLRIYLPAVTQVVKRDLVGSAHVHQGDSNLEMGGTYGSSSADEQRIQVLNDYAFRYPQTGFDLVTYSGLVTIGSDTFDIESIKRESDYVTVITTTPHGLVPITPSTEPAFSSANSYSAGDLVSYNGFLWEALIANPSPSTAPPSNSYWGEYLNPYAKTNTVVVVTGLTDPSDFSTKFPGPYSYDPTARYSLTSINGITQTQLDAGSSYRILNVSNTAGAPNQPGYILIDLGLATQEAPIPIVGVLNNAFILNPGYQFQYSHDVGSEYTYLSSNFAVIDPLGSDYAFYVTDTAQGRTYCEQLLTQITALGIQLELIIVYPDSEGWGYGNVPENPFDRPATEYRNNDVVFIYS